MQNQHYSKASPAAIIGGVAAACGATALLVRDALVTGLTVDHALAPVLVAITILAGHLVWQAVRRGRVFSACGLALLAILGSALTVYETAGRRAEVRDTSVAAASDTEKQRQHLRKMLAEAEEILVKHRASRDTECATGKGKKCDGLQYTASTWEAAVSGYKAELAKLPPPKPVDPKAERLAAVLGFLVGVEDASVKKAVATLEPFALPLFLEFGAIILFGFGLPSRPKPRSTVSPVEPVAPAVPAPQPAVEPRVIEAPPSKPNGGAVTKLQAERDLVTLLAMGKTIESQEWLAQRWNVGESAVSKWLAIWEREGLVKRSQSGRYKIVEAA